MTSSSEDRRGKCCREACFRRNPAILERRIDETVFLVNPEDDTIFYLNPLSSGLWHLLAAPISIAEATRVVQEAFPDTPTEQIAADVSRLITDLEERRLILRKD